jgi:hypothetical protein
MDEKYYRYIIKSDYRRCSTSQTVRSFFLYLLLIEYFSKRTLATNAPPPSTAGSSMGAPGHHFEVDLSYISSKVIGMI